MKRVFHYEKYSGRLKKVTYFPKIKIINIQNFCTSQGLDWLKNYGPPHGLGEKDIENITNDTIRNFLLRDANSLKNVTKEELETLKKREKKIFEIVQDRRDSFRFWDMVSQSKLMVTPPNNVTDLPHFPAYSGEHNYTGLLEYLEKQGVKDKFKSHCEKYKLLEGKNFEHVDTSTRQKIFDNSLFQHLSLDVQNRTMKNYVFLGQKATGKTEAMIFQAKTIPFIFAIKSQKVYSIYHSASIEELHSPSSLIYQGIKAIEPSFYLPKELQTIENLNHKLQQLDCTFCLFLDEIEKVFDAEQSSKDAGRFLRDIFQGLHLDDPKIQFSMTGSTSWTRLLIQCSGEQHVIRDFPHVKISPPLHTKVSLVSLVQTWFSENDCKNISKVNNSEHWQVFKAKYGNNLRDMERNLHTSTGMRIPEGLINMITKKIVSRNPKLKDTTTIERWTKDHEGIELLSEQDVIDCIHEFNKIYDFKPFEEWKNRLIDNMEISEYEEGRFFTPSLHKFCENNKNLKEISSEFWKWFYIENVFVRYRKLKEIDDNNKVAIPPVGSRLMAYYATKQYEKGTIGCTVHKAIGCLYLILGNCWESGIGFLFDQEGIEKFYRASFNHNTSSDLATLEYKFWNSVQRKNLRFVLSTMFPIRVRIWAHHIFHKISQYF